MAQRDPLVEYQREGFLLFEAMMDGIKEESVGYLFNVDVQVQAPVTATPEPAQQPVSVSEMLGSLSSAQDAPHGSDGGSSADGPQDDVRPVDGELEPVLNGAGGAAKGAPAFTAKGLQGPTTRQLHYTAPSDDGGVEERNVTEAGADRGSNGSANGSDGSASGSAGNRSARRSSKKARRRGK